MTTTASRPAAPAPQKNARRLFRELEHPHEIVSNLTPNWFASIMGTGIVANAAASLPMQFPGLRVFGTVVWAIASIVLVALTVATVLHWVLYRETAKKHHLNPVISHFYGAPAMAFLTVGAGTLLLGKDVIGLPAAIGVDWVLWSLGTAMGLVTAISIPFLTFTRHDTKPDSAFGGWLMPIVPPMVSASTGALLLPYTPAGQARETLFWSCYAMFGLALVASLIVITLIWARLTQHKIGAAAMVPTLWIVLGPLGQSITAVNLLGGNAHLVVPPALANMLLTFGLIYGIPVLGFALMWTALALMITIRTAREKLPFSLTWWSFTFPVGTCVTGLSGLALHTGLVALQVLACVYYAGLLAAWITVAIRTFHGSVIRGTLLVAPRVTA
ncbi:TDT family transporter [Frondihabitans cladoniiphilus]|uniref:TDT family transporter n=1 Tax=Frondihabitans cladoniiphilus TaxID=715785 RepID=A0ABP8VMB7_9MICO